MFIYSFMIFLIQKGTPFSGPVNTPKPNNNVSSDATPEGVIIVFIILLLTFFLIIQTRKNKK